MSDLVTIDISEDGIADVRFNRVDKYNALSPEMFQAIISAGEDLAKNKSVRVVVISGNGRGFCATLDMASMQGMAGDRSSNSTSTLMDRDERPENHAQRPAYVWKRMPVPVIAAIHGVAYGGGCQIALGADIRFMAPDAKMSVMEIKWGLIPDMSITQTLRDLMPLDVAKELTFTGRILNGQEAKDVGLVTHVTENPLEAAMALAKEIAGKSPDAIRLGKKLLEESWRAGEREGLEMESVLQRKLIGSPNQVEAIKANFENRAPVFKDAELG
ncbi:MAG: crotonase/enoyl-CoA hydratase family protein [Pseudomonadales bacterium]|nr:crotonase/enoyl-CoA hydratase family protein [Pseudomonadales bacterium]